MSSFAYYWYGLLYQFSAYATVICAISGCYYHGAEPAFFSSRPLLLSVSIPFSVAKRPIIYSYLGSDVSSAGVEPRPTTH